MTSRDSQAFVWIWLPGETEPVVAGHLRADNGNIQFNYGKSYLERAEAGLPCMSIYEPELPLRPGLLPPPGGLAMPGSIRDAAPDAWGRRVILNKMFGRRGTDVDTAELGELSYLLESGSDRIGALDFQHSATEYTPRPSGSSPDHVSMEELVEAAERVERGVPITPELDQALFHGSSIGGARPKALVRGPLAQKNGNNYIAKFSSSSDVYSVVKAEFIAMRLARLAGINVAPVQLTRAAGKDVLLIERFDRLPAAGTGDNWSRRAMVSALTILSLDDMTARYASYEALAAIIRRRFSAPRKTLRELFLRLVFNVLCGNTDDHARNHAAFWDGRELTLTPAYDICPQARTGNEASQAMLIVSDNNLAQLGTCIQAAHNFQLSEEEARPVCDEVIAVIEQHWDAVCDEAKLGEVDRNLLWGRQFLNPFSLRRSD